MAGKTTQTTIFLLTLIILLSPLVTASATQSACEIRATSCQLGETAIASATHATNAHAALYNHEDFSHVLCCNEEITDPDPFFGGPQPMFSISDSGSNQGHVSNPGVFDQDVQGNWDNCRQIAGTCDTIDGFQCLARVTASGDVSGVNQGHLSSCSDTNAPYSICCCPTGSYLDGGVCVEFSSSVAIIDSELIGPENVLAPSSHSYQANVSWGWDSPVYVEFSQYLAGTLLDQTSTTDTDPRSDGKIFSSGDFDFNNAGETYQVCVYAELVDDTENNVTECIDVATEGDFIELTSLTGAGTVSPGTTGEPYEATLNWGYTSNAQIRFSAHRTTESPSWSAYETITSTTGPATRTYEADFTTGDWEVCAQVRLEDDHTQNDEECVPVNAGSDFVEISSYDTSFKAG